MKFVQVFNDLLFFLVCFFHLQAAFAFWVDAVISNWVFILDGPVHNFAFPIRDWFVIPAAAGHAAMTSSLIRSGRKVHV